MITDRHADQALLDPRGAFADLRPPFRGAVEAYSFGAAWVTAVRFAPYAAADVHTMHLCETNRDLDDALDIAMRTSALVEQGKGSVMSEGRCDASETRNLRLRLRLRGGSRPWLETSA